MNEPPATPDPNTPPATRPAQLGRWISLGLAAFFLMVIVSVFGVYWKAKHGRQQAERFNRYGTSTQEDRSPSPRR